MKEFRPKLVRPCNVSPDVMDEIGDGNRFCHSCNKVVHNLVGKSDVEIKALFEAHGGRLCGMRTAPVPLPNPQFKLQQPLPRPTYFKHWAATASLLLLTQIPLSANQASKERIDWFIPLPPDHQQSMVDDFPNEGTNNTLISAVIVNQHGNVVPLDVEVAIYAKQKLVTTVIARYGFLQCDLAGKVQPNDIIGLVIRANTATDPESHAVERHGGATRTLLLRDAQNLRLNVKYDFPPMPIEFGDMVDPSSEFAPLEGPEKPVFEPNGGQ